MYCFVINRGLLFFLSFFSYLQLCVSGGVNTSRFILSGEMARSQERIDCVSIPWRSGVLERVIIYCYYVLEWNRMMCFLDIVF